jgi:hypothetical protein
MATSQLKDFLFFLFLVLTTIIKLRERILLLIVPFGLIVGIGIGFIFYRFYLRRLQGDTINLKGYRSPHIIILILIFIIILPVGATLFSLSEEGIIEQHTMDAFNHILFLFFCFLTCCFLSSIIVETILLFLWERKHKIKLFADLGGFWTVG